YHDVPPVLCYPNQLSQVFINLMKNAIEAMKDKEERKLFIEVYASREEIVTGQDDTQKDNGGAQECIVIKIKDSGGGIPKEMRETIFEPFVTTKGVLHGGDETTPGTGLGLSIVYGIIQRHQGKIHIDVQDGIGTTFVIVLPVLK
ncbi:MAG: HAMP domain-containing histidine kinase, partial [Candidatus Omnitrophica bacterium]|nr:HAMP domain-containing histidine kinase [Candidatus Omnitrophota bacterium]